MRKLLRKLLGTKIIAYDYKIVNIYMDKDDKITFIPTGESKKWRLTTDLNFKIELIPPYADAELEEKLFSAMNMCFSYEPVDQTYNSNEEKVTASKTYNKEMKGKRLISLHWNKVDGYVVEPFKKAKDRGFTIIDENVIRVGTSITKGTLANAIKEAMKRSEPY